MASIVEPVDAGQFDDAPEQPQTHQITREGNAYIDTYVPANDEATLDWPETSEDEAEDESDEEYFENRVEDEDWENAERGTYWGILSLILPSKVHS